MDLTTATPVEIDTVLARIMNDEYTNTLAFGSALDMLHYAVSDEKVGAWSRRNWAMSTDETIDAAKALAEGGTYKATDAQKYLDRFNAARAQAKALREEAAPLNTEFQRRGGWSRAFLATSANGHIHSSRDCSTCYVTTNFYWFVDLSGHDEAEIVTKAGSDACTVCYPSAPVNDLKRPRSIFSDDEKAAQQARVERDQAKTDRLAKKIANGLTQDGSEFEASYIEANYPHRTYDRATGQTTVEYKDRVKVEHFKTERAAVQWVVQYVCWSRTANPLVDDEKASAFAQVIEAVAAKHDKTVAEVTADIEAKVAAKNKRDSR